MEKTFQVIFKLFIILRKNNLLQRENRLPE